MFWWFMRYVGLGPWLHLAFRPRPVGLDAVPLHAPAIVAANHQSPLDTVLLPLVIKHRKLIFLAKAEYLANPRVAWFFRGAGVIPVRRGAPQSQAAVEAAVEALGAGQLLGIFPEGTRSPDGRLYRGKTGVARIALRAGVPVIPVGIVGTYEAMSYRQKIPRPRPTEIRFGRPLRFDDIKDKPVDRFVLRSVTDEVMDEIRKLTGQDYVDEDAALVRRRLDRARRNGRRSR